MDSQLKRVNENGVNVDFNQDIFCNAVKVVDWLPLEDVKLSERQTGFMDKLEEMMIPKAVNPLLALCIK